MTISQIITFLAGSAWEWTILDSIGLFLDAIVYSLVAYSYKLFLIMSQLNLNIIYQMAAPIVDRVKALIMVFVLFKLAITLIGSLLEPEKFEQTGGKILKNIIIAVVLLVSYDFIFELGNDLSMIALGTTDTSAFQILDPPEDTNGLVSKLIFGSASGVDKTKDFGVYLAASTLNIFLHDVEGGSVASNVYTQIINNSGTSYNFNPIKDTKGEIGRTVEYTYPIISSIMGIYLIYSIVQIAIQVGIRMFKMMILQIVAPIPICSIISDGVKGKSFSAFMKLYFTTLIQVAVRVATMFLATAFVGTFYNLIMSGSLTTGETGMTRFLVVIIIIVAVYRFVRELPKFLQSLFPGMNFEANMGGFGNTLRTIGNVGAGVGGFALGGAAGLATGGGFFQGALGGATSAYRGEGIRGQLQNAQNAQARGETYKDIGFGNAMLNSLGAPLGITAARQSREKDAINQEQQKIAAAEKEKNRLNQEKAKINQDKNRLSQEKAGLGQRKAGLNKLIDNARNDLASGTKNYGSLGNHTGVTSSQDLFNRAVSNDAEIAKYRAIMNRSSTNDSERQKAQIKIYQREEDLRKEAEKEYSAALDASSQAANGRDISAINSDIAAIDKDMDNKDTEMAARDADIAARDADIATQDSLIDAANANIETHEGRLKQAGGSTK